MWHKWIQIACQGVPPEPQYLGWLPNPQKERKRLKEYTDIHFRVTKEEKEWIKKAARRKGQNVSTFLREVSLVAIKELESTLMEKSTKEEMENLSQMIVFRVTKEKEKYYLKKATDLNLSLSQYVRKCMDQTEIIFIPGIKEMAKQVSKLGNNMNQLTLLAHQGKIKEVDLFSCNDTLKEILKQLIKLKKEG